ncbi:pilZ domain protein [Paraburkholderia xenovorans LB400]|uniref:PilZ domain-containing protein n=1 Tax=Paraburkholderia xenovorans (strain LB400) TaxID=266265 RepID=Q13FA5_PARXL|nr:PilZ domain-containing protein [Paraburkholderia xenovorans]ABE37234.1 hypothetical protein Bxe_C1386 [Paraburkholderia xenovorans LB400]AIP34548.1 pilZ domain protein [Paraburkholderia xenovorans LB400]
MALVKLQPGDITSDDPIPFPIYSADGKLLLQEGQSVTTSSLLDRLYDLGYRKSTEKVRSGPFNPVSHAPQVNTELLISSAHAHEKALPKPEAISGRSMNVLPTLKHRVEFFRLTPAGGSEAIHVDLVGVVHEKTIIVRSTGPDESVVLDPEHSYQAKLFTGSHLSTFSTRLTPDGVGPFGCYYLEYPDNLIHATVRKHRRVTTSFPAKLQSGEYQRASVDVTVSNISLIGAGVSSSVDFLTVGQSARLSMNLSVAQRVRPVEVYVEVRNRREKDGGFFYGLEFVRVSDEVRLEIKDFVLDSLATL